MASKAFLNTMAILGLVQVQMDIAKRELPDDEKLESLIGKAYKSTIKAAGMWSGTCSKKDLKKISAWMDAFNDHFHYVEINTLFSTGLALLEDLANYITHPERKRALHNAVNDLHVIYGYFDELFYGSDDRYDDYVEADKAVKVWKKIRDEVL